MSFNYSLEIIHKDGATVKFTDTFNGPHDGTLALAKSTLHAHLEDLARDPNNPNRTRIRLTLNETPPADGQPGAPIWDYELFLDHKNSAGKTRAMHMFNGPHDSLFQPVARPLKISLAELDSDPQKPASVRFALTMMET